MVQSSNSRGARTSSGNNERPQSHGENEKGMWSSMLDSVASGRKLPEKNVIVLGGSPVTQREFLDTLASDAHKRHQDRHKRKPVIANEFALGYTYQDVLDTDHEDILARLSIYLLSEYSPSFAPLLKPLLMPKSIPETLMVLLLDWNEPWLWVRQIRDWIVLVRCTTLALDEKSKEVMEETMKDWQQRKRGGLAHDLTATGETNVTLPLSKGEWDEPIGIPLCVVCHNADNINKLEIEQSWREEDFDYVLQFLRTILMKHGASLIYTSNSDSNSLPTLVHSSLGIHSLLKKQALRHNVIDRDKVLVPPNWDSWGKIRVLREGFDVEATSDQWTKDVAVDQTSVPFPANDDHQVNGEDTIDPMGSADGSVLPWYENTIKDPYKSRNPNPENAKARIEVSILGTQVFLANQLETLQRLKAEEEKAAAATTTDPTRSSYSFSNTNLPNERMNEQIGPVQVNVGGIQVDVDDSIRKFKEAATKNLETESPPATGTPDKYKALNENAGSFFADLLKRGPSNSPRGTPGQEGKRAARDASTEERKRGFGKE